MGKASSRKKINKKAGTGRHLYPPISLPSQGKGRYLERIPLKLFVVLLTFSLLAYGNSLHNPFIWDDPYLITDNHFIQSFRYLSEIFKHHLYYSTAGTSNFYRPLQTLFLMFDYALWKTNPFGYHLTSFLFHLLSGLAIFFVIELLFEKRALAFLVALLFLVHPINSTVVDYISSRADSQATAFMLLSFLFFFRHVLKGEKIIPYLLSLSFFILALLSKEMAIILPFFILVGLYAVKIKARQVQKVAPFFALLAIYGILRATVLNFKGFPSEGIPNLYLRLLTTCSSFVNLIGLLFLPRQIHIEKGIPYAPGFFEPRIFLSVVGLALFGLLIFLLRRRSKIAVFGFLWFFVCLLPMANIVPINTTLADHWLYLPGAGFFLGVIGLVSEGIKKLKPKLQDIFKKASICFYALLIILFSLLTLKQNTIWKDPIKFYQTALAYNPNSFRPYNELGVLYLNVNQFEKAAFYFEKAISLNEKFDQAYDNLGIAYDKLEKPEEAIRVHEKALKINPYNPKVYNNLGNAYNNLNNLEKAIEMYRKAIELNPNYKAVYNNIGVVYYKKGMLNEAIRYWEKALEIDPNFTSAANNIKTARETLSQ